MAAAWERGGWASHFGDGSEAHVRLGARLASAAPACARASHLYLAGDAADADVAWGGADGEVERDSGVPSPRCAGHPHRTLLHGDLKAANLFFPAEGAAVDVQGEVGLIDFQWSGWGLGSVDLAYLVAASAKGGAMDADGAAEAELLEAYRAELCAGLASFGLDPDAEAPSAEALRASYELALLDFCTAVFGYHWPRIAATPDVLRAREHMLGSNAYNKDLASARWLVARCAALLDRHGFA